jgi:hypothetical protein
VRFTTDKYDTTDLTNPFGHLTNSSLNKGQTKKTLSGEVCESREKHAKSREQRAGSREQRIESREQRTESREQRAERREQRAESRETREESIEQRAENRQQRAESREQHTIINIKQQRAALTHNYLQDERVLGKAAKWTLDELWEELELRE